MAEQKPLPTSAPEKPLATIDTEREKDILIGRLKSEVVRLQAEVDARDALERERMDAEAKAKADKTAKAERVPVALMPILGDNRREVAPKQQLRATELPGLTEGEHFEYVILGA